MNHIHEHKERIIEGELRCDQLIKHLERTNSPKVVFLCEDASGIVKNIAYDSTSNQLIGLVLPTNLNGMPTILSFEAKSAEAIEQYMQLPQSTLVYLIVAQPLKVNAPPFILTIFGTHNKFDTSDVLKRWNYIESELKK